MSKLLKKRALAILVSLNFLIAVPAAQACWVCDFFDYVTGGAAGPEGGGNDGGEPPPEGPEGGSGGGEPPPEGRS